MLPSGFAFGFISLGTLNIGPRNMDVGLGGTRDWKLASSQLFSVRQTPDDEYSPSMYEDLRAFARTACRDYVQKVKICD